MGRDLDALRMLATAKGLKMTNFIVFTVQTALMRFRRPKALKTGTR
jgi:hypothetical protein